MPSLLLQRIEEFSRENLAFQPGDTIIVAISGGADSTALLHVLNDSCFELRLVAVYIDHGLRPHETGSEIKFVRNCTAQLKIPFVVRQVNVHTLQEKEKCSPEEAARIARYSELERLRQEYHAAFIAVAHTADDQVEELLIRLIRGTGLKGLSGMSPQNGNIIRPLLTQSKTSLVEYLTEKKLGFCHDSSNDERTFLRNKVRLDLLPLLEKDFNPSIRNTILQTTEILQQDEDLLATISDDSFQELTSFEQDDKNCLTSLAISKSGFVEEHPAIQRRVLESCCWKMGNRPSFRTIHQLQDLIGNGTNGAQLHLAQGLRVHLIDDTIRFFYPAGKRPFRGDGTSAHAEVRYSIINPGHYQFSELGRELMVAILDKTECDFTRSDTLFAGADSLSFPLTLRSAQPGERFRPYGSPGSKKIARILNDMKIRADIRGCYPLLTCGDRLIAIVGARLADDFKVTATTEKILVIRWFET